MTPSSLSRSLFAAILICGISCTLHSCKKDQKSTASVFTYNFYYATGTGCTYTGDQFSFVPDSMNSRNPNPSGDSMHTAFKSTNTSSWTYLWDFGDGTTATASSPTHAYSLPGTYIVSLTINNDAAHAVHKSISVAGYIMSGHTAHMGGIRAWSGTRYVVFTTITVTDTMLAVSVIDSSRITFLGRTLHIGSIDTVAGTMLFGQCPVLDPDGMNYYGTATLTYYYSKDSISYFFSSGRPAHEDYQSLQLHTP